MKLAKKIAIIVALICIFAGVITAVCGALYTDWSRYSTPLDFFSYEEESGMIDITESFESISVNFAEKDLRIRPSDNNECKIEYSQRKGMEFSATVENGVLTISEKRTGGLRSYISFGENHSHCTLYIPKGEYKKLTVHTASGDVVIPSDFSFEDAEIHTASGDVSIFANITDELSVELASGDVSVADIVCGNLYAKTVSGEIELNNVNAHSIELKSTSGDTELQKVVCEGTLKCQSTSGEIELSRCDASDLELKSTSGDISGSLLSEKVFMPESTSGDIKVPYGGSGGTCKIETTSGDISFRIAQ